MTLILQNVGEIAILTSAFGAQDLSVSLFSNNYTPTATTTLNLMTECSFDGYQKATLEATNLSVSEIDGSAVANWGTI
jgi:hypothetical protein